MNECTVCPKRVLRCAHFGDDVLFMIVGHKHTLWHGTYGVYLNEPPFKECFVDGCSEPLYQVTTELVRAETREEADAFFDKRVEELLCQAT